MHIFSCFFFTQKTWSLLKLFSLKITNILKVYLIISLVLLWLSRHRLYSQSYIPFQWSSNIWQYIPYKHYHDSLCMYTDRSLSRKVLIHAKFYQSLLHLKSLLLESTFLNKSKTISSWGNNSYPTICFVHFQHIKACSFGKLSMISGINLSFPR